MKHCSLLLLSLLLACTISAKQVEQGTALAIAQSYLKKSSPKHMLGVSHAQPQLKMALEAKSKTQDIDYYVFNNGTNNGYVIVAGDDRAMPILGYSDQGSFDPANVPDGMQCLLDMYAQEMAFLRSHNIATKAEPSIAHNPVVKPLLKSNWDQKEPYNRLCPEYYVDGQAMGNSATGCVATAAAQLMYYYRWPDRGEGRVNYQSGDYTIDREFDHYYDWDNMLDNYVAGKYTEAEGDAVATLMYDAGVAGGMQYGKSSNTSAHWMMNALRTNFKYNKGMKFIMRGTKTINEWEQLIFNELNNKRPIIYGGFTSLGGHAFILDGYNEDGYFHFNWGWSARSNGYFLITALNPRDQGAGSYEGGYNASQSIIINAYPDQGEPAPDNYLEVTLDSFRPNEDHVALGESVLINRYGMMGAGYGNGNNVTITSAYVLTDVNNNIVQVFTDSERDLNMSLGTRYRSAVEGNNARKIIPSTSLAPGDYRLHFMYKCPDAGITEYRPYDHSSATAGYWNAHVADGVMTFTEASVGTPQLKVDSFDFPAEVGDNTFFKANFTLSNSGDDFMGSIYVSIKKEEDTEFNDLFNAQVNIPKDGSVLVKCELFAPRGSGNYQMFIRDQYNRIIDGPRPIVVAPNENYELEAVSQLTVGNYYMAPDNVTATIDIKNVGTGEYVGPIYYRFIEGSANRFSGSTQVMKFAPGETKTINFATAFEGQPYTEYIFNVFPLKGDEQLSRAPFQLNFDTTSIEDINTNGSNAPVRYVNPMGQVSNTPFKGINIVIDGDRTYKVVK